MIDRDTDSLHPVFRWQFLLWLEAARSRVTHVAFRVTETRRTLERQEWLYAQGREEPYWHAPAVTWTMDSRHRWGLAADIVMIRLATGDPVWEVSSWMWLYREVPLEPFALRHLGPREWLHIEYAHADAAIRHAGVLGLTQS